MVTFTFTPKIGNGTTQAIEQVGSCLVDGGSFTTVTPTGGAGAGAGTSTAVARRFIFAFNAATSALEPYLNVNVSGHHNFGHVTGAAEGATGAVSIAVPPDRTRAIVDGNSPPSRTPSVPTPATRS